MTRFIQFPMDKTKMPEVRASLAEPEQTQLVQELRSAPGVQSMEVSFCPGQGWLALRYTFNDLEAMKGFGSTPASKAEEALAALPWKDASREAHEFKGFYLWEV
eukprot:CAMPEP_0205825144 /NCGR_PEP_ID=MMETSP0206-20130828/24121_1 /ASSEMBLY_ACC=CAM_ASM_000279 /TAXON_ID=36767 /ORGANISM="Euplotes focardii, Strain TN1" /LENGTH=103 /DNA_ID=CAMNT_0053123939 /DNA_START=93 /DNA_END=404 /DNA_ORIENTATION=+